VARVLIADDDPHARLLVGTLLAHAGHTVFEAADGRRALELARDQLPDLTIVDLSLPVLSGPELVRALRKDERTRSMRVALYTAGNIDAAIRDFMQMYGIITALPKPSEPAELLAAIQAAL